MTPIVWPLAAVMLVQAMLMVATVTVPVLAPELALATKIEPHWNRSLFFACFCWCTRFHSFRWQPGPPFRRSHHESDCSGNFRFSLGRNRFRYSIGNHHFCSYCWFWVWISNPCGKSDIGECYTSRPSRNRVFLKAEHGLTWGVNCRRISTGASSWFWMARGDTFCGIPSNCGKRLNPPLTHES